MGPAHTRLFVGRDDLLRSLRDAAAAAVAGHGGLVLLTGEPGIGKTTVAAVAAEHAGELGARVLWATCWDGEGVPGFWPWTQLLTALLAGASGERAARIATVAPLASRLLLERQGAEAGGAERFALFDEVASLLQIEAAARPLVLVIDDLQWADPASLRLLDFVVRRLRGAALLVIATCRDVAAQGPLARVLATGAVLPLAPLRASEVERLVAAIAGEDVDPALAAGVHRRAGGNPFFVHQVTRLALAGAPEEVPAGVRDAVERRLAGLSADCARVLRVATVLGAESRPEMVARVAGEPPGTVRDLLDEAARARVLVAPERPLGPHRFAHDLFREALYGSLGAAERARLHLAAGRALAVERDAGRDVAAAELAHHFLRAVDAGVHREAVRHSILAAEEATRRLSYEEAAVHWRHALDVLDAAPAAEPEERNEVLIELARAHSRAGEVAAARERFARAADGARRAGDQVRLARSALGLQAVGIATWAPHDELVALLDEAAAGLDEGAHAGLLARVLAGTARELAWFGMDLERAAALAQRAVAVARAAGDERALTEALVARHNVEWGPGTAARRLALADEVLALAGRTGDRERLVEARILRAADLLELGDPAFHAEVDELARAGSGLRQPRARYAALVRRATQALLTGPLDVAERLIEEAAALGREIDEPDAGNVRIAQLWEVRSAQGRRAELLPEAERSPSRGLMGPHERWMWVTTLLEQGDREAALSAVAPLLETDPGTIPRDRSWAYALTACAGLVIEMGAVPPAGELVYELLAPYEGGMVVTGAAITLAGAIAHHLGVLAAALGHRERARVHLELALAQHERLGARLWVLRTRFELARLGLAGGREALAEVRATAAELGMAELARAAEAARPAAGVFRQRDAATWELGLDGTTVQLPDAKGLHDIARLLGRPGEPIPAVRLIALGGGSEAFGGLAMGADPLLDQRALREVRARLAELNRLGGARDERDALARELAAAAGLGGRTRRLGDLSERARKTVTARTRDALRRIEAVHPALAAHLRASIATGTACTYSPPVPTSWEL